MKKNLLVALIIGGAIFFMGALNQQVTVHESYRVLRVEADEDTPIALTTAGNFAAKPASAIPFTTRGQQGTQNTIALAFSGGDTANDTFSWRIYGWRMSNGPAELIANGTGILGTQQVVIYPQGGATTNKFWADSLSVTTDYWMRTVAEQTVGGNSVAKLMFDFLGYEWIYVEITDADGATGIQAGDITVYYSFL